jgi:hypothetical protein
MLFTSDIDAGDIPAQYWKPIAFVRHDDLMTPCANTTARVGVSVDSRPGECPPGPRQYPIATQSHAENAVSHASEIWAALPVVFAFSVGERAQLDHSHIHIQSGHSRGGAENRHSEALPATRLITHRSV